MYDLYAHAGAQILAGRGIGKFYVQLILSTDHVNHADGGLVKVHVVGETQSQDLKTDNHTKNIAIQVKDAWQRVSAIHSNGSYAL